MALTRYWHGGPQGYAPGDWIAPRDRARLAIPDGFDVPVDRGSIYVATDRGMAESFATLILDAQGAPVAGALYNVQPEEPVTEDPDFAGLGVSWACPRARVVAVVKRRVRITREQSERAMSRWVRWDDGTRMRDASGHWRASANLRARGITDADLRHLGKWKTAAVLNDYLIERGF